MPDATTIPLNVREYEGAARDVLDAPVFDFFAGGAGDEISLAENEAAFRRVFLRPRILVDASHCSTATRVLELEVAWPVMIAPLAYLRSAHADGELGVARAARKTQTLYCLSSLSTTPADEIGRELEGIPWWFQLYPYRDRSLTAETIERARSAGSSALVVTVDTPRIGRRERDLRNAFVLPEIELPWVPIPSGTGRVTPAGVNDLFDQGFDWRRLEQLVSSAQLPVVLKGVLTAEDAALASACGVSAVVVSNHGGRQLDCAPATLDVLPEVVEAVGGNLEIYLDGGIRRGTDAVKALALGARAVLVGRPVAWGLAVAGEDGVRHVLDLLRAELKLALTLMGRQDVTELAPVHVRRPGKQLTVERRRA